MPVKLIAPPRCWIAVQDCCGEVMRGPTSSPKANDTDEIDHSIIDETKHSNDSGSHHLSCSRTVSNSSSKKEDDGGTPIWKMGRILIDSLSKGKMRRTKIFGAPLEDLPLSCQGIPKIAQRLCCYLEQFGLKETDLFISHKKQGKLVERYKISFDRAGDADLESCNDVKVIASLLKLWLHDLPNPLIPQRINGRLRTIFQKYERKEIYDLNSEVCNVLVACPALNLGVLYTVIRLLYYYATKWYSTPHVDQLSEMFAKILIRDVANEHVEIISTLIRNFREIFNERILERAFKLYVIRDKKSRDGENRSPHLPLSVECGNSPLSVDKLPRSNSEEKLCIRSDHNQNLSTKNLNMRRVNSHEDFISAQHNNCRSVQMLIMDSDQENTDDGNLPKYRPNSLCVGEEYEEPVVDKFQKITYASDKDTEVLKAPPPFGYNEDYHIQEEIRNAERFSPQFNAHRPVGRRKRIIYQGGSASPKGQSVFEDDLRYAMPKLGEFFDRSICDYRLSVESSMPVEWTTTSHDSDAHSTSSTSSSSSSECTSPVKSASSPESAQHFHDYAEPLTSFRNWSYGHRHPYNSKTPNLNRHSSGERVSSSHAMNLSHIDSKILQVNKHLQWIKKKMKRFEKEFEENFGEPPTIMNKMSHPEYKQMSTTIICLKNNLKQLRKEANDSFSAHRLLVTKNPNNSYNLGLFPPAPDKRKAFEEAEKQMYEKRILSERPESVEEMTEEHLQDEKVSIQKELSILENMFGQTAARNEDLFKPIYNRYRTVKRYLARTTASLKLKESISDLATINENETMEFESGPAIANPGVAKTPPPSCQPVCNVSRNDFQISNIHELSSPELMIEYRTTKEEKKKLRNRIYMYEQEAENRTLNDSKQCIHSLRCRYKNTKAKLKLLEALLMKAK